MAKVSDGRGAGDQVWKERWNAPGVGCSTSPQLGQRSSSRGEVPLDLLKLCQGGDEEILGWGALNAPALPTSQQSPFLQQHALERGQGILVLGSPLS